MKLTIRDNAALAALDLARQRTEYSIQETLNEIETLQESHTHAVGHLDKLHEKKDQLTRAIRLLQ